MAGLTSTGLAIKDLETLLSEIAAAMTAQIDTDLNTEADSVAGQLNGIISAKLLELWELVQEVYLAAYPDTATGQALSNLSALTGTIRRAATKATVDVACTFTGTPTLPVGTAVYVDGDPDSRFELLAEVALTSSPQVVTFTATTAGSSTVAYAHPTDTAVIDTPVSGWTAATFDADYTPGTDVEKDDALRARRLTELAAPGAGTVNAIRADLLAVTGVESCTVFENATGVTDSNGLPAKSIEALVSGTYAAQDIIDQLWLSKPAGTQTYGSTSGTATDSANNNHTVYYSTPTEVPLYVDVTLTSSANYVGDAAVKTALADWSDGLLLGEAVYASDIVKVVMGLEGVESVDLTATFVEDSASPTTLVWTAGVRELGTLGTGNITVTSI